MADRQNVFSLRPVPPPAAAPINQLAESLGLVRGLKAERNQGQFRCSSCSHFQPRGSILVWVPDTIRRGDPAWAVEERCRETAHNGHASGWCLKCAPKKPRRIRMTTEQAARDAFAPDLLETRHMTVCNCTARQLATGEHHRRCYLSAPQPTIADDWREFWSDVAAAPAHHAAFAILVLASVAVLFVAPLILAGWVL